jgi:hypothetical protein
MILCIEHPQVQGKLVQTVTHRGQACRQQKAKIRSKQKTQSKKSNCYLDVIEIRSDTPKTPQNQNSRRERYQKENWQNGGLDDFQTGRDSCIRSFYVCPDVRPGVRESVQTLSARDGKEDEIDA